MDVVTLSPVLAARVVWRRAADRWALSLVVKATFDLLPGEVRPSAQPLPLFSTDVHDAGNPSRGLVAANDLVPFKPRADVLLVGHAYAPLGRPVSSLTVRLAVGGVDKTIAVVGNRAASPRGISPALPFTKMPLLYEKAAGGPGTANPAGLPRGEHLPNLEAAPPRPDRPGTPPTGAPRGDARIGFGPIAASWPDRAAKQRAWRWDEPPPDDLDTSFFNAAPPDQQVPFLRGDETILLENLHPDHAVLSTRLAGLVPRVFVERFRPTIELIDMRADTLWIDTDRRKAAVVWRGEVALSAPEEPGRILVAMTNAREPLGWEQVQELYRTLAASGAHAAVSAAPAAPAAPSMAGAAPVPHTPPPVPHTPPPMPHTASPSAQPAAPIEDDDTGSDGLDEMLRTNAVPAAGPLDAPRPSLDTAEDLGPGDDPLDTSTRAFPAAGPLLPSAAPAWLTTPAFPPNPPSAGPEVPALQKITDSSAADLQRPDTRTGPLPVLGTNEPASPWASGLEPGALSPIVPAAAPSGISLRAEPPRGEPAPRAPSKATWRAPSEAVDLLWFDPESVARVAAKFREIVDELDMEPLDPEHDLPVDDPLAARDRHHLFGVLTRAPLTDARGVTAAVRAATDPHGRFTPPVVVVEGELVFDLDEQRVLKTTAACAKPMAKENPRLQAVLGSVDELLDTPLLQGVPGATDGLYRELVAAYGQSKRAIPVKVLEEQVERLLLGQRAYQTRVVLGGPQIRAGLSPVRDTPALTAYLPEAVGPKLPLSLRFRARLIGEIHPSPDPQDPSPLALKVVAIGRLVALPGRG